MAEYREYFHCFAKLAFGTEGKGSVRQILFFVLWGKKEDFPKALATCRTTGNFAVKISQTRRPCSLNDDSEIKRSILEGGRQTYMHIPGRVLPGCTWHLCQVRYGHICLVGEYGCRLWMTFMSKMKGRFCLPLSCKSLIRILPPCPESRRTCWPPA